MKLPQLNAILIMWGQKLVLFKKWKIMLFFNKDHDKYQQAREITDMVVAETKKIFESFHLEVNNRFREIQAQMKQIDTNIELLERKIVIKEMNDRHEYGHLHYKLHEVKNTRIRDEIDDIKKKLQLIKTDDRPN